MDTLSISEARANLFKLIDQVAQYHKPVHIHGRHNNAVLLSEEDFNAMQETFYIMQIPGLYQDLKEGIDTSIEECTPDADLKW
ncbi:MAG: type II toxin-antitoxin system Phd/YefM family antitoxin [Alphaproteobacteria bacterium]|nr:type II toxin-antitoxin system Phd/YefM family antitoxin [Alphaproteobacteria bacterium]